MSPNSQETANLATFTEGTLMENFIFCAVLINIQDYSPLKIFYNQEEFISINKIDRIIKNLDMKNPRSNRSNRLLPNLYTSCLTYASILVCICQIGELQK